MDGFRFAAHRLITFSEATKDLLAATAERLIPHEEEIVASWVRQQWAVWQPPNLSREELHRVFAGLARQIFGCMISRRLDECILCLEEAGAELAASRFPFQVLIISIHFFEESYLPWLISRSHERTRDRLVAMDEFLHAALAALAASYFEAHRRELLDEAAVGRIVQEELLSHIPARAADLEMGHVYPSAHARARRGGAFRACLCPNAGLAFIIGDLSGHGIGAAADSVMLRSLFRGFLRENADPGRALSRLSRVLEDDLRPDQFATALATSYGPQGRLRVVSAGHCWPVICDEACRLVEITGLPLAVAADTDYPVLDLALPPGGVFVAYTDGLVEARDGREVFGDNRLLAAVRSDRDAPAQELAEHLVDQALRFGGGKLQDDVAVLVLKRDRPEQ